MPRWAMRNLLLDLDRDLYENLRALGGNVRLSAIIDDDLFKNPVV